MAFPRERQPVLILGIGNILMADEGIGVRAIEAMQQMVLTDDVELFDGGTAGADLIDVLSDREKVIVIDAMDADLPPGTILRLTPEQLSPSEQPSVSLHEIGLIETLAMAKHIGTAPKETVVVGVQPRDILPRYTLSDTLSAALPRIIDQVLQELPSHSNGAKVHSKQDQ
jgi:hydrogenase maturation protease